MSVRTQDVRWLAGEMACVKMACVKVPVQAIIGVDRAILRRRSPLWHSEPESEQLVFRTVEEIKAEHAKEIEAEVVRSLKEA